jgi:hypothetical protein
MRRMRTLLAALPPMDLEALAAWEQPSHNLALLAAAYALCFHFRSVLLLGTAVLCAHMVRQLVLQVYLGSTGTEVALGEDTGGEPGEEAGGDTEGGPASARGLVALARWLSRSWGSAIAGALGVQNALDDAARALERCAALLAGRDVVASSLAYGALAALAAAVYTLGPAPVAFASALYALRPPALRGIPAAAWPHAFVEHLPCAGGSGGPL